MASVALIIIITETLNVSNSIERNSNASIQPSGANILKRKSSQLNRYHMYMKDGANEWIAKADTFLQFVFLQRMRFCGVCNVYAC